MASEQARQAIRQFSDESYALANRVSLQSTNGYKLAQSLKCV